MSTFLKRPFLQVIGADQSDDDLSVDAEILLARVGELVYRLVQRAPQTAIMKAAAAGSDVALLSALTDMVITEAPAPQAWAVAHLKGRVALASVLEESGGVWSAEEAMAHLRVTRQTLQQWRNQGRVLALARPDGSFSYPLAQFKRPEADTGLPRPYEVIRQINDIVGARLSPEELVGLLASPQAMLVGSDGTNSSPFAAIAAGEVEGVLALVRWVVTPADEGAPAVAGTSQAT